MIIDPSIIVPLAAAGTAEGDCACPGPEAYWAKQTDPGEQDCACPDSASVAPAAVTNGIWRRPADLYCAPLPGGHQVVFAPSPTAGIAVLNAPAHRVLDAFARPRRLADVVAVLSELDPDQVARLVTEMARQGLLQCEGEAVSCQAQPYVLTAWLHVTRRCNLNCAYCYAPRGEQDMSQSTGRAAAQAIVRAAAMHGFRAIKIKYAGGEPLLNLARVCAIHNDAQTLAAQHGLALREVLLSNGLGLDCEVLRMLHEEGIQLAISLDGIGARHEAQRGAGTFAAVARALDLAASRGVRPYVSITVTTQNVSGLRDTVAYVLDRDLPLNLNFYREHPGSGTARLRATDDQLVEGVRAALTAIEQRLPRCRSITGLLDRVHLGYPHQHACGAGVSYLAVDPDGHIAHCHMELNKGKGTVWDEDPLRGATWPNLPVDAREMCASCTWRYWCAGGCPLLSQRLMGRDDGPSPYCRVYRTLLPEILRLEGLRLLESGAPVA